MRARTRRLRRGPRRRHSAAQGHGTVRGSRERRPLRRCGNGRRRVARRERRERGDRVAAPARLVSERRLAGAAARRYRGGARRDRRRALHDRRGGARRAARQRDRKSTRLNSSHTVISYAVFCLKKKKTHMVTLNKEN